MGKKATLPGPKAERLMLCPQPANTSVFQHKGQKGICRRWVPPILLVLCRPGGQPRRGGREDVRTPWPPRRWQDKDGGLSAQKAVLGKKVTLEGPKAERLMLCPQPVNTGVFQHKEGHWL